MHAVLSDLIELLQLERIEDNFYRGQSRDIGSAQVFGGQVLGQALSAAHHTVEGRRAHSLHAYFLRRGDMNAPIIYEVDRSRDGGSFSVRRVVAIQHGRPIFNLAASFQKPEEGLEHQAEMPDVPGPNGLQDLTERLGSNVDNWRYGQETFKHVSIRHRPVEIGDSVVEVAVRRQTKHCNRDDSQRSKKHGDLPITNCFRENVRQHQLLTISWSGSR